jgi:hypothetical protein
VPNVVPSSSSTSIPTFSTIQTASVPSFPSQQQQSTNIAPTNRLPFTVPPPVMPPFNFTVPNPQQNYFQPIPPPVFTNPQQQQQQQAPFQFNPNAAHAFPTFAQQTSRASPHTPDNYSHSHDYDSTGHGHSHDQGHGHSH